MQSQAPLPLGRRFLYAAPMPELLLGEAMTRFQCNLKGCCCGGWLVRHPVDDIFRVAEGLSNEQRLELFDGATVHVDDDGYMEHIEFATVGPRAICGFLTEDGQCGLHARYGAEILPQICRAFPAFTYRAPDGQLELYFDAVCPEVLAVLDASEGPYEVIRLEPPEGSELTARTRSTYTAPPCRLADRELEPDEFRAMRLAIVDAFNQRQRPALDVLATVGHALARMVEGERFELRPEDPVEPFEAHLDECVAAHDARYLSTQLHRYWRFVQDDSLPGEPPREELAPFMGWQPDWRTQLDPHDPELEPLLARFLAHRFFSAYDRSQFDAQVTLTLGTISQGLGTAFRLAVGCASWLGRPVDRAILKVALGASEYILRAARLEVSAMPWFGQYIRLKR